MRNLVFSLLLVVADFCLAQTVVYTTDADGNISAYLIASSNGTNGTSSSSGSAQTTTSPTITSNYATLTNPSTTILLPTAPYTGQSLLVGSCSVPVYTALRYGDGHFMEVPLIGCSDDRPECCPSLDLAEEAPTSTSSRQSGNATTTASQTPTGVISMLSRAPLTVCPSDMVDIDPVCCPSGFTIWGQAILGNTPCASLLSTSYPLPSSVLESLTSSVAASATLSSGTAVPAEATQSITVIVNTVFALGLPCADEDEEGEEGEGGEGEGEGEGEEHKGLSTGAKAGIGAGVGSGVLLAIGIGAWVCMKRRRRVKDEPELPQVVQTAGVTQVTEYPAKMQPGSGGFSPTSPQDAGYVGYGQGFVDGVKAALSPPMPPQSPPPPFSYGPPQTSFTQPPVEAPSETTRYARSPIQDEAAEMSGSNTNTRSSMA